MMNGTMRVRPFSTSCSKPLKISSGPSTNTTKKESAPDPDGIPHSVYRCAGGLGSPFLFNAYRFVVEGSSVPSRFAASRTIFFPESCTVDDNGLIERSPDASRPLTQCNCDCKAIISAVCFVLHRYSIRCTHPAQRCVSSRQMTGHMFEIETAALAQYACATSDSGILLTDFACAYPSVNHSWIFHEKAGLPMFVQQFLCMVYNNSFTK